LYLSNRFPDKNHELLDKKRKVSLEKSGICQTWVIIILTSPDITIASAQSGFLM